MRGRTVLLPIVLVVIAGFARQGAGIAIAAGAGKTVTAAGSTRVAEVVAPELSRSAWRLLNITEMNDSVELPNDPGKYTLTFGADGTAGIVADCNRGTGSWTSDSEGRLTFGPIAATMARCSPESLSEKYLGQFEWVRSYVLQDGHLFLATMADGSIIEFEPLPAVAAIVLGEEIRTSDAAEMQARLLTRLFDAYATAHGIEATDAEIHAYVDVLRRGLAEEGLTADDLRPEDATAVEKMRREMTAAIIRHWKINKSLYEEYGGRVIYQQLGPEPLDAYREYLEARQQAGDFSIEDSEMAKAFWRYFTDESIHDFMEPGGEEMSSVFAIPPWERVP